ncbi:acyl-CoA dehydrogenase [Seongchinamella sediminis]|uniref:Medium-chain specific acyl-CoA dehydrogenase, mitochondrial n=1 Tax=Seongchinamella sediminis TaxID=2283635 RepID=A0A3L7DTX9_9GAMM|nr:acyl-CoA dehydrogenase [Seongchinamella sediminis]RLQ21047.1 acyl-CoA dehydrogenase [Seongchinamella sediminis]
MSNYINLPLSGLEEPLSEMEQLVQDTAHRFAEEVLRPAGTRLDGMSADDAIAPESPLWAVLEQSAGLGLSVKAMLDLPPLERERLLLIAAEELAWGEPGLGGMVLVSQMPGLYAALAGNLDMVDFCDGKLGCWGITEPDHGSDSLDAGGSIAAVEGDYGRANCVARIEGDTIIVNGQKSAWVSGGTVAEVCALYCHYEENGEVRPGISLIVPLDLPGVTRGKPLEKIGLRALNQGEIYFDNVEVPLSHLLAGPEQYVDFVRHTLAEANVHVANMAVGIARAAYEHAHAYAHERKQGGLPIIRHQSVKYRLFHMFRKVEASRALVRRVMTYNATAPEAALQGSISAKVTATQSAFEVASDAVQIFGGNGLTREYPVEKLLRDARAMLIADGCNEVLALKGGSLLVKPELL